jgi:hypothetical protein
VRLGVLQSIRFRKISAKPGRGRGPQSVQGEKGSEKAQEGGQTPIHFSNADCNEKTNSPSSTDGYAEVERKGKRRGRWWSSSRNNFQNNIGGRGADRLSSGRGLVRDS